MRIKMAILLLAIISLSTLTVHARMVYYHDEEGKIHYVNTDFAKVPEQYMYQVLPQLEQPEPPPEQPETPNVPAAPIFVKNAPIKKKIELDVFIADGCDECTQLEVMLRSRKILYNRHDVNTDPLGRKLLEEQGQKLRLPLTTLKGKSVVGADIRKIVDMVKEEEKTDP